MFSSPAGRPELSRTTFILSPCPHHGRFLRDPGAPILHSVPLLALLFRLPGPEPSREDTGHLCELFSVHPGKIECIFLLFVFFCSIEIKIFFFLKSGSLPFSIVWPVGILAHSGHERHRCPMHPTFLGAGGGSEVECHSPLGALHSFFCWPRCLLGDYSI